MMHSLEKEITKVLKNDIFSLVCPEEYTFANRNHIMSEYFGEALESSNLLI